MATFTEELLFELEPVLKSGAIKFDFDQKKYSNLLTNRFPFTGSKIAWSKVPNSVQEVLTNENPIEESSDFMHRQLRQNKISDKVPVIVIGDNAIDCVFITTVDTLKEVAISFFVLPQHLYIIPYDAGWCMVFSMEGDMCFGYAPAPD